MERSIQTIKRTLSTEKLNSYNAELTRVLQTILDDIWKFKHDSLIKSRIELKLCQKPQTKMSLVKDKTLENTSSD